MPGVKSVEVSLKTGLLEIVLVRDNTFKMSDLRKRENGFRSMEPTVTAVGEFNGAMFEVSGSDESYSIRNPDPNAPAPLELTFDVR
jgi:stalled ribosome rescue protein Dom34